MIQPRVLLGFGRNQCGRYLAKKLEQPIDAHLCMTPPVVLLTSAFHEGDIAALCEAHCDELITAHPEWVGRVLPLNDWGESEVSKAKAALLATFRTDARSFA